MNKTIATFAFASLLATAPLFVLAAEKTNAESAVPPSAMPGINQSGSSKSEDKASKKGEEASGSNSGAESEAMDKETDASHSTKDVKKPKP
ncbi:hypothetical protein [Pseudomonas frederiksbergensis]|uniref:Uncharacterized protein n=1 Tax=Pseudomonas frederiksbergensis TaxID=104087 RepID=A0A423KHR5_9PSED|nr:hypothetical protein [Pseudomonas frederiksbergensis]RON52634.1 hypothetical protein BK665_16455 [Pseudomonas frederiksbergensis]